MISDLAQQFFKDLDRFMDSTRESAESAFSQDQFKTMLAGFLKRMDLVTREEFDAQQAVLLRTREKLDALEKQVAVLEELAAKQDSSA